MTRAPVRYITTSAEATAALTELRHEATGKPVAVDTEFDPETDRIRLMSYSWGRDIRRVVHGDLVHSHFGGWLVNPSTQLVYQNYKADGEQFEALGLDTRASFHADVMVMGVLVDETLLSHGLKAQAAHFLNWKRAEYTSLFSYTPAGKKRPIVMNPFEVMDDPPADALGKRTDVQWRDLMLEYSGDDAESTWLLYDHHKRVLMEIDYWDNYLAIDAPYTTTLMGCSERGVRINVPRLRRILRLVDIAAIKATHCFRVAAGKPDLNLNSIPQMKKLLVDDWEWPVRHDLINKPTAAEIKKAASEGRAPDPSPQLNREAMTWWYEEKGFELAAVKLAFNNAVKLKGTFLEGILNGLDDDGRLRSDFNQIGGKRTGRISSRKRVAEVEVSRTFKNGRVKTWKRRILVGANLQNIPSRPEKDPYGIRAAFVAPRAGDITARGTLAKTAHKLVVCLTPETRVLRADMTYVPIGDVKVGDKLVGFDEGLALKTRTSSQGRTYKKRGDNGRGVKFRESIVKRVSVIKKTCFKITTDKGTVTASDEHMWVAKKRSSRVSTHREWVRTDALEPGDEIAYVGTQKSWQGRSTWGKSTQAARVLKVERVYDGKGGHTRDVVAVETTTKTFIAEGMLSHNCDYSGFELCMAIHWASKYVPDSPMLAIMRKYGSPSAVHAFTAIKLYAGATASDGTVLGKINMGDWGTVKKLFPGEYLISKNNNFNLLYGGSAKMMARLRGLDHNDPMVLEECQQQATDWNDLYTEITVYQKRMVKHGYKKGWVPTISGRRIHVDQYLQSDERGVQGHGERVCMNGPCQGSAADIVKVAMNLIEHDAELYELGASLLFPVHDEVVLECPDGTAQQVLKRTLHLMKQPFRDQMAFEIAVEGNVGDTWAEAK